MYVYVCVRACVCVCVCVCVYVRFQPYHEVARQALQALTLRAEYELLINSIQVCLCVCILFIFDV